MKARATKSSLPSIYRGAIEQTLKDQQTEIAKRLILTACLVGSDLFEWGNEECNKFKRGFEEVIHGYSDEIYKCRDNVGKIEDMRLALENELISRGIKLEAWA